MVTEHLRFMGATVAWYYVHDSYSIEDYGLDETSSRHDTFSDTLRMQGLFGGSETS